LYGDRVNFLAVYVREAHPTDGWRVPSNDRAGITIAQPKTAKERTDVAKTCCSSLSITIPMVVDEMDDRVGHAYSGMPDRLYLIDREGRIAYKGGRGPFGFKAGEMEQALVMLLLDQDKKAAKAQGRVPLLEDADAWKRLPPAVKPGDLPLPNWAKALADSLPRTTAAMLELDYLHRAQSPIDPILRGKMRWVTAHANRCAYGEAYAAADLRQIGVDEAAIKALAGDRAKLPEKEQAALDFAEKLTLAADTVTDEEVARLIKRYDDKQVVAMVLLLAYANFQDRLLLTLGVPVEEGGPLPPLAVYFDRSVEAPKPAPRKAPQDSPAKTAIPFKEADWEPIDFAKLQEQMDKQRQRQPRIRVPAWEDVLRGLPKEMQGRRPSRIKWSLVCMGYQPELTMAWLNTMGTFGDESKQDRAFEESLFWVVTRSLNCFY
jgi:alkylhydroperoxidase family enzyme